MYCVLYHSYLTRYGPRSTMEPDNCEFVLHFWILQVCTEYICMYLIIRKVRSTYLGRVPTYIGGTRYLISQRHVKPYGTSNKLQRQQAIPKFRSELQKRIISGAFVHFRAEISRRFRVTRMACQRPAALTHTQTQSNGIQTEVPNRPNRPDRIIHQPPRLG